MQKIDKVLTNPKMAYRYAIRESHKIRGRLICDVLKCPKALWGLRQKKKSRAALEASQDVIIENTIKIAKEFDEVISQCYRGANVREQLIAHSNRLFRGDLHILNEYRSVCACGQTPDWHIDYKTGYKYRLSHFSNARENNSTRDGTDIKRIWEQARMQYLLAPAYLFYVSGEEKYAEIVVRYLTDYIDSSPFDYGPLWQPSMEVGIRLGNIILVFSLVARSRHCDKDIIGKIQLSVAQHYVHIIENPENLSGVSSNHYLGGLFGVSAYNALVYGVRDGAKKGIEIKRLVEREALTQLLPDGFDYEGSSSYQRLVGELFCGMALYLRCADIDLSEEVGKRVLKASNISRLLTEGESGVVQIGDNDSGRAFQLLPEQPNSHESFVKLAESVFDRDNACGAKELPLIAQFGDNGVVSVRAGKLFVVESAFDPSKYGLGGHCHNDLLAFSFSIDGNSVVVDPGTGSYTGDKGARNTLRSVHSHSTISVGGCEQRRLNRNQLFQWPQFEGKTSLRIVSRETCALLQSCTTISSYKKSVRHDRRIFVESDGSRIVVKDELSGDVPKITMFLPLHPNIEVTRNNTDLILIANGNYIIVSGSWTMEIGRYHYSPYYDKLVESNCVCLSSKNKRNILCFRIMNEKRKSTSRKVE